MKPRTSLPYYNEGENLFEFGTIDTVDPLRLSSPQNVASDLVQNMIEDYAIPSASDSNVLPVDRWIRDIEDETMAYSSARGIREHRLYATIKHLGTPILSSVFGVMREAPYAAITIAADLLGANGPKMSPDDKMDFDRLLGQWLAWGRTNRLLPSK
jgi:hypothetical protein